MAGAGNRLWRVLHLGARLRLRRLPTLLVVAVALSLGGCGGVLDPQGPISAAERLILFNATGIMLVVVLPVIVLTLVFGWWYRAGNKKAAYNPNWEYSGQIELVVWSIPAMIVILVAGVRLARLPRPRPVQAAAVDG